MAGDRDGRPQYQAMLSDVRRMQESEERAVVVVASLDRLGRRLLEAVRCREELKALRVGLHSVREGELPDLVANILSAVAQDEIRRRRDRLSGAWQHVVNAGWFAPGATPWGYLRRRATDAERGAGASITVLDIDESQSWIVKEVFRRAGEGAALHAIKSWMEETLPHGTTPKTVRNRRLVLTLRNPVYVGRVAHGSPTVLDRAHGQWPPIVDDAVWAAVQQWRSLPVARGGASGRFLLTRFLRCPRCGRTAVGGRSGASTTRSGLYYRCAAHRTCKFFIAVQRIVDGIVLGRLGRLVSQFRHQDRSSRKRLQEAWLVVGDRAQARTKQLATEHVRVEIATGRAHARLARAAELLATGQLDPMGYELARDEIQGALDRARGRVAGSPVVPAVGSFESVLRDLDQWETALAGSGVSAQREVLAMLISHVDLHREERAQYRVEVKWTELGRAMLASTAYARRQTQ